MRAREARVNIPADVLEDPKLVEEGFFRYGISELPSAVACPGNMTFVHLLALDAAQILKVVRDVHLL